MHAIYLRITVRIAGISSKFYRSKKCCVILKINFLASLNLDSFNIFSSNLFDNTKKFNRDKAIKTRSIFSIAIKCIFRIISNKLYHEWMNDLRLIDAKLNVCLLLQLIDATESECEFKSIIDFYISFKNFFFYYFCYSLWK